MANQLASLVLASVVAIAATGVAWAQGPQPLPPQTVAVTIACPATVGANSTQAPDGWMQTWPNGWLEKAYYFKNDHFITCSYRGRGNPAAVFTSLQRKLDNTLTNCVVSTDMRAVVCDQQTRVKPGRPK